MTCQQGPDEEQAGKGCQENGDWPLVVIMGDFQSSFTAKIQFVGIFKFSRLLICVHGGMHFSSEMWIGDKHQFP